MPWPALGDVVKGIDISKYQNSTYNDPVPTVGRIRWDELKQTHPEVQVVMIRLAGSTSGIDPDFAYNFEGATSRGYKVGVYVNVNPGKPISELSGWWRAGMGSRKPKVMMLDAETDQGQSPATITGHVQGCIAEIGDLWPDASQIVYSAAWWWNGKIVHGWEGDLQMFVANYAYLVRLSNGDYRRPYVFEEADVCLPIDNNFTPLLCKGTTYEQTIGWQFTDKGRLGGILTMADLDYFKRSWVERVFGVEPPSPPIQGVPVEIRYKTGAVDLTVTET